MLFTTELYLNLPVRLLCFFIFILYYYTIRNYSFLAHLMYYYFLFNLLLYLLTETIVSSNLQSKDSFKKSKLKELDSFSFIIPETTSVQQRLENKKKYVI